MEKRITMLPEGAQASQSTLLPFIFIEVSWNGPRVWRLYSRLLIKQAGSRCVFLPVLMSVASAGGAPAVAKSKQHG